MPLSKKNVQIETEIVTPKIGQPEFKSPADDELAKERNRLLTIRSAVEVNDFLSFFDNDQTLEKAFKENIISKRHAQDPLSIFSEEASILDVDQSGELVKGAKDELQKVKSAKRSQEDRKVFESLGNSSSKRQSNKH